MTLVWLHVFGYISGYRAQAQSSICKYYTDEQV